MPWTDIALCSALQPTDKCTLRTFFSAKKKTQTFFYLFNSIPDKYCIILELNRSLLYLQKANSPASKPTNQPANKYANHINTVKCRFSKTAALICMFEKLIKKQLNAKNSLFNVNECVTKIKMIILPPSELACKTFMYEKCEYWKKKQHVSCGSRNYL